MSDTHAPKSWSSQYLFIVASIGSTVGLSNIWKFTYLAGENGGGAFVLIYLLSLTVLGIPILAAEMLIGKRGGSSTVGTFKVLQEKDGLHSLWKYFGWAAMLTVFLILSFYSVIAGWTLDYTITSLTGKLASTDATAVTRNYQNLMDNPLRMMLGQAAFISATVWIVSRGVKAGLERSLRWMMPALFFILVALVIYAAFTGNFADASMFMFAPDFSRITPAVALSAFGQAFFSLGIGVGVMLTYGAYMPKETPVLRSAAIIAFSDGLISILAGLAIFPIVFQFGLSPAEGPGLIFLTLPITFSSLPGGGFIGSLFFVLLFFAALTSSISLLESIISHLEDLAGGKRKRITLIAGVFLFVTGLGTVFSFNRLSDFTPLDFFKPLEGKTIFGLLDYFGANLMMPLGGILMAAIAGWMMSRSVTKAELNLKAQWTFETWLFIIRITAPVALFLLFLANL